MKLAKLLSVVFIVLVAVIALTVIWVWAIASKVGTLPNAAVDIAYVVTRPFFLLELVVILALAGWVCWRWVFARS